MQIWKFPIEPNKPIEMPKGAKALSVQTQHGEPFLWAMVDPSAVLVFRKFVFVGTGQDLPSNVGEFIDTLQMAGGGLIFHVFNVQS